MTPQEGPALYYIDSDGTRLAGNLFCVGSGQTFAYGVLDAEYRFEMTEEEALELGRRSVLAARMGSPWVHRHGPRLLEDEVGKGGVLSCGI
jgi:20S proteasome alpha/beta subunit